MSEDPAGPARADRHRRRRRRSVLAATVVVSLVLALVLVLRDGGDEPPPATDDETGILPLLGTEGDVPRRAALAVKIDDTSSGRPQSGLADADIVFEELVEGGSTRLAVFYYSDIPDEVGPVRSMRASDIGIVAPVGATMVTSGAASVTIARIQDAGIPFFAEGDEGLYREDSRSAPYNLMADLEQTTDAASGDEEARPVDYLPWGDAEELPARAGRVG